MKIQDGGGRHIEFRKMSISLGQSMGIDCNITLYLCLSFSLCYHFLVN